MYQTGSAIAPRTSYAMDWKDEIMWPWRNNVNERQVLGNYLAQSLTACPNQSNQTWMQLAEIYRKAGNKTEYEVLTARLRETDAAQLSEWVSHP